MLAVLLKLLLLVFCYCIGSRYIILFTAFLCNCSSVPYGIPFLRKTTLNERINGSSSNSVHHGFQEYTSGVLDHGWR